jgi:uncharacterized protein YifE (UPF0438 family)
MDSKDDILEISAEQIALIEKHIKFLDSLADGTRNPSTHAQVNFVEVTLGHLGAQSEYEIGYIKYRIRRLRLRQSKSDELAVRDPERDGPTDDWFTRENYKKLHDGYP